MIFYEEKSFLICFPIRSGFPQFMVCYLIDDDDDDRDFLEMALEEVDRNIKLLSANNAEDALRKLRSKEIEPHIIFLDLNMPRIDGWQCLRLLKETEHLRQVPVIIYSTSENGRDPQENPGYNEFLTKQSKISDLVVKLREIFSKINV